MRKTNWPLSNPSWENQSKLEDFDPYGNWSLGEFVINTTFFTQCSIKSILIYRHGTQSCRKERREESRKGKSWGWRKEEEERKEKGKLCYLHLQGVEASSSRHWYLQQSNGHHELVRQRHLRAHRHRSFPPCPLQQEINHQLSRDPDRHQAASARWIGQARRQWGNEGCDQVHQQQVNSLSLPPKQTALLGATKCYKSNDQ